MKDAEKAKITTTRICGVDCRRIFSARILIVAKESCDQPWAHQWSIYDYLKRSGFCEEAKITDLLLVFFTYCLVIVGWFGIRATEQGVHVVERAYIYGGIGVNGRDLIRDERNNIIAVRIRFSMANYGKTPGFVRSNVAVANSLICRIHRNTKIASR